MTRNKTGWILLILATFLLVQHGFAQKGMAPFGADAPDGTAKYELYKKGNVTISGQLVEASTKKPLEFANVVLKKQTDSQLFKALISNPDGQFTFENIPYGPYVLEVSFVGLQTYTNEMVMVLPDKKRVELGTIELSAETKALSEVVVAGKRPDMSLELDKKVFQVSNSVTAQGGSASDLLKTIPSIDVDVSGNVSLRNAQNVTIYINGKPSGMNSESQGQLLQQMPASVIEKVELITNPSAKYNAEGNTGIINIVMKKNRQSGYFGSVMAGVSLPEGYNLGGNLNYNKNKLNLTANYGLRSHTMPITGSTERTTYGPDTVSYLSQKQNNDFRMTGHFFNAGADYEFDAKNKLGFTGFGLIGSRSGDERNTYNFYDANHNLSSWRSQLNDAGDKVNVYNLSLDYTHQFETKGEELSLVASNNRFNRNNESDQWLRNYSLTGVTDSSLQRKLSENTHTEWIGQMDYTYPFSDHTKMEAGMKSTVTNENSNLNTFDYRFALGSYINNRSQTNVFDYTENVFAAYASLTSSIGKFSYQAGLRTEQTRNDYQVEPTGQTGSKQYLDWFPSLFLSQKVNENNELQLSYTRRINRPRPWNINPFENTSDSLNISKGNPDLKPEYTNALELNFIRSGSSYTLTSSVYYRQTEGVIQSIRSVQQNVSTTTFANLSASHATGFELIGKLTPYKWLDVTANANLYYYLLEGAAANNYADYSTFTWTGKLTTNVTLAKGFSLQLMGNYNAPTSTAQGKNLESYSVDAGLRKSFFKNMLMANLSVRDLFETRRMASNLSGVNFSQQSESRFMGRMVNLTLALNFGNTMPKMDPSKMKKNQQPDMNEMYNGF